MKTCLGTVHLLPVHGGMKWHKSLQSARVPLHARDKEAVSRRAGLEGTDVDGEGGSSSLRAATAPGEAVAALFYT